MGKGIVFMGVAFELVALCGGGVLLGQRIDAYMGWQNMASIFLVLILMVGWFTHLVYLLRQFEKSDDDSTPRS